MTLHSQCKYLIMNALLFSTAKRYFSAPEKLHILAQLAEGLLTDAQTIDKYQLNPTWRRWRHQHILKKYNPRTVSKPKKSPTDQLNASLFQVP